MSVEWIFFVSDLLSGLYAEDTLSEGMEWSLGRQWVESLFSSLDAQSTRKKEPMG